VDLGDALGTAAGERLLTAPLELGESLLTVHGSSSRYDDARRVGTGSRRVKVEADSTHAPRRDSREAHSCR
jgi:hypothetical protein